MVYNKVMKKNNIIPSLIATATLFLLGLFLLFLNPTVSSGGELIIAIRKALMYSMPALAFVFFLLLLVPRAVPAWKKFANWYIPCAVLLFIFYDGPGGFDLFSPYPEDVYKWASVLYVFICVGIITWTLLGSKKNNLPPLE